MMCSCLPYTSLALHPSFSSPFSFSFFFRMIWYFLFEGSLPWQKQQSAFLMLSVLFLNRFHAERAIEIITHILPEDHLLLASSKRVKGLYVKIDRLIKTHCTFETCLQLVPLSTCIIHKDNILFLVLWLFKLWVVSSTTNKKTALR